MLKRLKIWIQNWVLRTVCNSMTYDQVLVARTDVVRGIKVPFVKIGNSVLPQPEAQELVEEAKALRRYKVYGMINASVRSLATDALVNKSTHIDDMTFAKAMLYTLDVQEKTLKSLADL